MGIASIREPRCGMTKVMQPSQVGVMCKGVSPGTEMLLFLLDVLALMVAFHLCSVSALHGHTRAWKLCVQAL